LDQDQNPESIF